MAYLTQTIHEDNCPRLKGSLLFIDQKSAELWAFFWKEHTIAIKFCWVWKRDIWLSLPSRESSSPGSRATLRDLCSSKYLVCHPGLMPSSKKRGKTDVQLLQAIFRPDPTLSPILVIKATVCSAPDSLGKGEGRKPNLFWLTIVTEGFCAHLRKGFA